MIGGLIRAAIGSRIAGRHGGAKGALLGAAAPWLVRRALTPLGLVALGLYGAKKYRDNKRVRQVSTG